MPSKLITPQGYQNLQRELDHLWRVVRPETTAKVSWAASLGDRSENADYQYNKKRLREIDRRVRYLRKTLEALTIVHPAPEQQGRVFFGAWVTLVDEAEVTLHKQIVGYDEIFQRKDAISIDSPMARALLGKQVNDDVLVKTPELAKYWTIIAIDYEL